MPSLSRKESVRPRIRGPKVQYSLGVTFCHWIFFGLHVVKALMPILELSKNSNVFVLRHWYEEIQLRVFYHSRPSIFSFANIKKYLVCPLSRKISCFLWLLHVTFISLHIRSMWETICDAQAGFWLNSKFLSKFSRKPLSGISDQKAPLPHFGKVQIWDDQSLLRNTPPFWKSSDLRWPKFTPESPPILENFRFEMTKVDSRIPPSPPPFRKMRISYVETNL